MRFITDKQTLDDLKIIGMPGSDTVYSLYNNTRTKGGANILERMFLNPLSDAQTMNDRSGIIKYFSELKTSFPLDTQWLDSIEIYIRMTDERTKLAEHDNNLVKKLSNLVAADGNYKLIYSGVNAIINIVHTMAEFIAQIKPTASETAYDQDMQAISALLADPQLQQIYNEKHSGKLSADRIIEYDNLFRFHKRKQVKHLLDHIYQLDVYIAVGKTAVKLNYTFPKAVVCERNTVLLTGVYHPLVKNAVGNNIFISPENNVIFLTGANMAGKSTFMKSLGIALYLAHMGFPVAALKMEFSVRDGMYTTINLPDDLGSGNSHFYAEVLRIKKIAKELGISKNLFVIFDELFRGTNVKDAYDGTIAITQAFAQKRDCMFVVSTHIVEAGEVLKRCCPNISFIYLPTNMDGNRPVYTYKLKQGITADKHGMVIINNEGILEIIRSRKNKKYTA